MHKNTEFGLIHLRSLKVRFAVEKIFIDCISPHSHTSVKMWFVLQKRIARISS